MDWNKLARERTCDWDDIEDRVRFRREVGEAEYARHLDAEHRRTTVKVVNGYRLRTLKGFILVDGTGEHIGSKLSFRTLDQAVAHARGQPPGPF